MPSCFNKSVGSIVRTQTFKIRSSSCGRFSHTSHGKPRHEQRQRIRCVERSREINRRFNLWGIERDHRGWIRSTGHYTRWKWSEHGTRTGWFGYLRATFVEWFHEIVATNRPQHKWIRGTLEQRRVVFTSGHGCARILHAPSCGGSQRQRTTYGILHECG